MTYTTIQGDTFDGIAFKLYGEEKYMKELIEANLDYADVLLFSANIELTVPQVEEGWEAEDWPSGGKTTMRTSETMTRRTRMNKDLARRVATTLCFSRKNVDILLKDYLESVSYTDVASGSSDTLDITLQNIDEKWLSTWYPKKGNTVSGKLVFKNWLGDGRNKFVNCGTHTMDEISVNLSPKTMKLSCVSSPAKESFKTRERVKTWEGVSIKQVAQEICKRYKLKLKYTGANIIIDKLEQNEADSSFLMNLCDSYGFGMKIYRNRIVIYGIIKMEKKKAICKLGRTAFTDISFTDGIYGTYTGARVSYRPPDTDEDISIFIGLKEENAKGSRVLKVNESCSSEAEARRKGASAVNKSNMKATTMSGTCFPNPRICAGVCIRLDNSFGKLMGKYFIDRVTWDVSGNGATTQRIEAHKVKKKVKS